MTVSRTVRLCEVKRSGGLVCLGGDGHHVVGAEDLNPVTVGVLNESQAFHFTWQREME